MINHLFKMIWNQKGRNAGLIIEIFFSFLVLFAVLSFIFYNLRRYKQPLGFSYKNVWVLRSDKKGTANEEALKVQEMLALRLKSIPEIESFTFTTHNIPYSNSTYRTLVHKGDLNTATDYFQSDANFAKTVGVEIVQGHWYGERDKTANYQAAVINTRIQEKLFPDQNPIGQIIDNPANSEEKLKIVGVLDHYKYRGEFAHSEGVLFKMIDTAFVAELALLKMKPSATAATEAQIIKSLNQVAPSWAFEMQHLVDMRVKNLNFTLIPMIIFLTIAGFLVFNVALGLFGVLWYNINKRREEIGLRRALGATKINIGRQFISEVLVLATLSISLGVFFAVQLPILNVLGVPASVYFSAIIGAVLLIYLLVVICAFYPSRLAATLHPAVALHEE